VSAAEAAPVTAAEANSLFADLAALPALVLAVSGGPDSTALLLLAAEWRELQPSGPRLLAVTVDHGLRPDAAAEAQAVRRLAEARGVAHRIATGCWPPPPATSAPPISTPATRSTTRRRRC
jgi:tRNA(Ile)-lysidine synthase